MTEMFSTLGTWNWLIFGVVLMALELLAPGVFLFWLGLAALLVGLLSFAINPSWQLQILMFAVFATAAVPLWRRMARNNKAVSQSNPFLNKRADAPNQKIIMLPMEAVSLLGSLAGIGEIAKATFGESAASATAAARRTASVPPTGGTPPAVPPRQG